MPPGLLLENPGLSEKQMHKQGIRYCNEKAGDYGCLSDQETFLYGETSKQGREVDQTPRLLCLLKEGER
jgi:hypothetical protein